MFDVSKLSRDFKIKPLETHEDILESDLRYMYCESGLRKDEICAYFPCSTAKLYRLLKKYNINKVVELLPKDILSKIDFTRLSRNYIEKPLKCGERPTKEDVEYLYIYLELTREEISRFFGRGNSDRFTSKLLKEYNIKLPVSIGRKRASTTYKARTGYDTPLSNPEVHKKAKETCLKKYGVESWMKTKAAKEAQGVLFNTKEQVEQAKITRVKTNLERYGVAHPNQSQAFKDKLRESLLSKYGATSYPQSLIPRDSLDILQDPGAITQLYFEFPELNTTSIAHLINVSQTCLLDYVHKYGLESLIYNPSSSFEREIIQLFPAITFKKDRTILDGKEIDLYSPQHKIGIEFNGNYWHSDANKDVYYHRDKSKLAATKGVLLFHIFEYEWGDKRCKQAIINRLRNMFGLDKIVLYARKCIVKPVNELDSNAFLNANHVQGQTYANIRLGLYYNNELVSLMLFTKNSLNNDHEYELSRFCSKAGTNIAGGASKLFRHFIKNYKPMSVVSYSDTAKSTGKLYETLGFTCIDITRPQYHWTDGNITLNRYKTQKKKLRKLGWIKAGEDKTESQVMRERGFFKIYDCGKKVWSWVNKKTELI